MTCIDKIILAFVIVQVAVVLAKPYEPENDDGLNQFSDDMDNFVYKREGGTHLKLLTLLFIRLVETKGRKILPLLHDLKNAG